MRPRPAARQRLDPWTLTAAVVISLVLLVATAAVMETPIARTGLDAFVVLLAPMLAILTFATFQRLQQPGLEPPSRWLVISGGAFVFLLVWAAASVPLNSHRVSASFGDPTTSVAVPAILILGPLLTASATFLTAVLAVRLADPKRLPEILEWMAVAGVFVTAAGLIWNGLNVDLIGRFATRIGGAAVFHVPMLLGLAICAAGAVEGRRRLLCAFGVLAYAGYLLATGARAGLITLGVFLLLTAVPAVVRAARRRPQFLPLLTGLGLAGLGGFAFVAMKVVASRGGLDTSGAGRSETWAFGLDQALSTLPKAIFGVGYGVLWPWFGFEIHALPQAGKHDLKQLPSGTTLAHAHNLYVAVFAELGVVGFAALTVVLLSVIVAWRRSEGAFERFLSAALVATLVGFAFDTYLIKNFPLSLIWWCSFASLLSMQRYRRRRARPDQPITLGRR